MSAEAPTGDVDAEIAALEARLAAVRARKVAALAERVKAEVGHWLDLGLSSNEAEMALALGLLEEAWRQFLKRRPGADTQPRHRRPRGDGAVFPSWRGWRGQLTRNGKKRYTATVPTREEAEAALAEMAAAAGPLPAAARREHIACGKCGGDGHNARTCPGVPAPAEAQQTPAPVPEPASPPPPARAAPDPHAKTPADHPWRSGLPASNEPPKQELAPPQPPRPAFIPHADRRCSVCGEPGHRASNARHRVAAPTSEPEPELAPPPELPSDAREPIPSRRIEAPAAARAADPPPTAAAAPLADAAEDPGAPAPTLERARRHLSVVDGEHRVRSRTIPARSLSREEKSAAASDDYPTDVARPQTRGDCASMPRPCPFVSCAHHLYLEVSEATGALKLNFPHLEPWEMAESCSLDVADRAGATLEQVGEFSNLTRERVRQIETAALAALQRRADTFGLSLPPEHPAGYAATG